MRYWENARRRFSQLRVATNLQLDGNQSACEQHEAHLCSIPLSAQTNPMRSEFRFSSVDMETEQSKLDR